MNKVDYFVLIIPSSLPEPNWSVKPYELHQIFQSFLSRVSVRSAISIKNSLPHSFCQFVCLSYSRIVLNV